jgi:Protein of unknown function (DUF3048) N-terminal domain/Protein of unknown function (DUF3048) C-terminal domain
MTSGGDRARWRAAALSCGVIAALAGCSAGAGGHPAAAAKPAAATSAAQPAGRASRAPAQDAPAQDAPAQDATAVAPLTGQAVTPAVAQRPAVAVAVSGPNPAGLGSADLVYEETSSPVRYLAVFQSAEASAVGPVARTRPTDGQVLSVLHPLTGYAGGTAAFVSVLDATKIVDVGYPGHASLYSSGSGGLTTSTAALAAAGKSDGPPPGLFFYRDPGAPLAAAKQTHPASVRLDVPGQPEQRWDYDAKAGRWVRTAGGPRASVANLIVQIVDFKTVYLSRKYGQTAQSARAIGTGPVTVFSAASAGTATPGGSGTAAAGTWVKPGLTTVTNYLDASGVPMDFAPGPTWIMLTPAGTRIIPAGG